MSIMEIISGVACATKSAYLPATEEPEDDINQEKKRWQHLATKRGDRLKRIAAICGTEAEE